MGACFACASLATPACQWLRFSSHIVPCIRCDRGCNQVALKHRYPHHDADPLVNSNSDGDRHVYEFRCFDADSDVNCDGHINLYLYTLQYELVLGDIYVTGYAG